MEIGCEVCAIELDRVARPDESLLLPYLVVHGGNRHERKQDQRRREGHADRGSLPRLPAANQLVHHHDRDRKREEIQVGSCLAERVLA